MALIVAFVAAITNGETPLNVLQLLWVNLIMDSLAALGEGRWQGLPRAQAERRAAWGEGSRERARFAARADRLALLRVGNWRACLPHSASSLPTSRGLL